MNTFIEKQYKVYKAKNTIYGNSFVDSLKKWGDIAFAVRVEDKIKRIKQMINNTFDEELKIIGNESLLDTVKDLFNYCSMFFSYYSNKPIIDTMKELYTDNNLWKMILCKRFGDKQEYILNPESENDMDLFNRILNLLDKIIKIEDGE